MLVVVVVGHGNCDCERTEIIGNDGQWQTAARSGQLNDRFRGSRLHRSDHGKGDWQVHARTFGIVPARAVNNLRDQRVLAALHVRWLVVDNVETLLANVVDEALDLTTVMVAFDQSQVENSRRSS